MLETEVPQKPLTVQELAKMIPDPEVGQALYKGFDALLQNLGTTERYQKGILWDILASPFGGNYFRNLSTEVEMGKEKIPFYLYRPLSNDFKDEIYVDIGMRTSKGERVALWLNSTGQVHWKYLDRSVIGQGLGTESPTQNDLSIHAEVLLKFIEQRSTRIDEAIATLDEAKKTLDRLQERFLKAKTK